MNTPQAGDILLYHNASALLSRIIAWGQRSAWARLMPQAIHLPPPTHALICTRGGDDPLYIEADWGQPLLPWGRKGGVVLKDTADLLKRDGYHSIWRTTGDQHQRINAVWHAQQLYAQGLEYDFLGLLSVALLMRQLSGASFHHRERYFCSELVAACYGVQNPQDVSPALLPWSLGLKYVGRIDIV